MSDTPVGVGDRAGDEGGVGRTQGDDVGEGQRLSVRVGDAACDDLRPGREAGEGKAGHGEAAEANGKCVSHSSRIEVTYDMFNCSHYI